MVPVVDSGQLRESINLGACDGKCVLPDTPPIGWRYLRLEKAVNKT
jgi:hypothetical protein